MYKTAIDLGYGYVKGLGETVEAGPRQIIFPSYAGPGHDRSMVKITGENTRTMEYLNVKINGENFFVGELALSESRAVSSTMEDNKINHRNTRILLTTAAALLGSPNPLGFYLVTGLPYGDYRTQKDQFEKMLREIDDEVEFLEGPLAGQKRRVRFPKTFVFVQGLAVVYSSGITNLREFEDEIFLVIEVGTKTTEIIGCTVKKGQLKLKTGFSKTLDTGMNDVLNELHTAFQEKTGKRLRPGMLQKLLQKETIKIQGEPLDFGEVIKEAKRTAAGAIMDHVNNLLGGEKDFVSKIFIAGGGGKELARELRSLHKNCELVPDAIMANCRGYLKVAEIMERNKQVV